MSFLGGIAAKITGEVVGKTLSEIGKGAGSIMNRFGFTPKMSDSEKIDKFVEVLHLDEASTDSAREMFITEMQTQKQPFVVRLLNGLVRPLGGLGAIGVEFYAIVGENISSWFGIKYLPIVMTTEQHVFLLGISAFYFGSRSREIMKGVSTQR